ncbi:ABC antibiotics transporter [Nocardioides cavernae]|uniref:ABC antibiotics transporter n=1 Tax=Nocardioides cavernae TaxID=1921566 RepID=A0ABR8NDM0_9ACTN|nr:ABC antibiotics transporter [Nocardioides cavernae]MBD3926232.1 ABC antibiotics transporter [Nocardioides cavernae]MBM7513824.1 ABC-2 type transport system permease protein [Nocardioides cavernae]
MSGVTGWSRLALLALRRDRVTLPAWVLGMSVFLAATTAMFDTSYADHPELLEPDTRIVVENPGMRVLGLVTGPSVGGYALHRDALVLAVLAAMMGILAVVRHTRQAEELGRSELVAAGATGRYASLAAAVVVALVAEVALAVGLGTALLVAGQPVAGSFVGGASIALVGMVFTGVAAVTAQLASTTRGATGAAAAVLGVSFALAALGNMVGTVDSAALRVTSAWPAWVSPIGWGQQMRPFADDLWWPLGLAAGATAVLVTLAGVLAARRDVGRGMWPEQPGAGRAGPTLVRPAGLVWRLQRGPLLGWAVGLLGTGLIFGALSERIGGLEGAATQWYESFGGATDLLGAYWASMLQIAGTAVAIYVVALLLRLRHDEAGGVLEPVLGTAVTRLRWLGAYAVNAVVGATLLMLLFATAMVVAGGQALGGTRALARELAGAALVQLPAIAVLGAAVVVVVTVLPRWATGVAWGLVVLCVFVGPMFGPSLGLPSWVVDLSPFSHVPNAPAVDISQGPLLGLGLVAALLAAAGVVVLRRRNLVLPA